MILFLAADCISLKTNSINTIRVICFDAIHWSIGKKLVFLVLGFNIPYLESHKNLKLSICSPEIRLSIYVHLRLD